MAQFPMAPDSRRAAAPAADAAGPAGPRDTAPEDGAAAGPAMTTLRAVATWTVTFIRCVVIVYVAVQVAIWHSFFSADAWRLAGPAAAVAWGAAVVAYLRRRWPSWPLAGLDAGAGVLLALGTMWCVPAAMRGDTANWLYIVMVGQLLVPAWLAPTAVVAPLALASGAAYWAGAAAVAAGGSGGSSPAGAGILLLAVAAAAWFARRMLERSAARADVTLAQADRDAREQHVVLSRSTERREHERLLHDTVLNTLTGLARPDPARAAAQEEGEHGGAGEVVGRCRRDVALLEYALSSAVSPARAAGRPYGGLLIGIEAAAIEMRERGLDVHVEVAGPAVPGRARAGAPPEPDQGPAIPVPVAVAISYAVREALANVVRHAGTREAWVGVSLGRPDGEAAADSLEVTVRDAGAGFDPAGVDPVRLGLRRSIVERITEWGGRASIRSAPGQGTVVSLRWPGPAQGPARALGHAVAAGSSDGPREPW
jgi:signal transduction histidine kinase